MRFTALFLLFSAAMAQVPKPPAAEVFGSVTVHVICGDTNQPARLARVTLQPVGEHIEEMTGMPGAPKSGTFAAGTNNVTMQTGLDGSVTIPRVSPGRYYVIVQLNGYLSPLAQFTLKEMNKPDDATRSEIEKTIPVVAVAAQQSSPLTVRLVHGATISGTLRFDDGSPVVNAFVDVEHRTKSGDWMSSGASSYGNTDDQGHYRFSSFAPGVYHVITRIETKTETGSNVFGYGMTKKDFGYVLTFYSGDGIRESTAKSFKVGEGENSTNNDITIPVARLHSISGTVVDAQTGAALNSARVTLYLGDDKTPCAFARTNFDDSTFHFDFVLEGDYTIKVSKAQLVRHDDVVPAQGAAFDGYAPKFKEVALKTYGNAEAPLKVQTDMTGVTLPVAEAATKPKAKTVAR